MNEIEVFKKLASNLTDRKSVAALSNYDVLCNNISFSHELLEDFITSLASIISELKIILANDEKLKDEYKKNKDSNPFTIIVPSLLLNDFEVIKKLSEYTAPDNRDGITVDNVSKLHKDFVDYNELVTATRQFVDSLITSSYQIQMLQPKELNYHVLLSLNSFAKYATKSIRRGLFNDEIESALTEFKKLSYHKWKHSGITSCQRVTFAEKVDFIFQQLNKTAADEHFKEEIKNIYHFSSEFTHIGYISTFFTSQYGFQPIFGGDKSPYLPSTENFSELKYEIIETCINLIYQTYLPSINFCIKKMVLDSNSLHIKKNINDLILFLESGIKTRNNSYYFFICSSLIKSSETIELPCICGYTNHWSFPRNDSHLFCKGCGSSFSIMEIEGNPGYIPTSNGLVKVIGSNVPDFQDLSPKEQEELCKKTINMLRI